MSRIFFYFPSTFFSLFFFFKQEPTALAVGSNVFEQMFFD